MLAGLATLAPILPIIRDHHFSPHHKGSLEQHIVYFADVFERLLAGDKHATTFQTDMIIGKFRALYRAIDPPLCQTLCQLAQKSIFGCTSIPDIFSECWRSSALSTMFISISTV